MSSFVLRLTTKAQFLIIGTIGMSMAADNPQDPASKKDWETRKQLAEHHVALGDEQLAARNIGAAITQYSRSIEYDPKFVPARAKRAQLYMNGKPVQALEDLRVAIEVEPDNAALRLLRGQVLFNLERYDDAIEDCTRVIDLRPTSSAAYYLRGEARGIRATTAKGLTDLFDAAVADLKKAIALSTDGAVNPAEVREYLEAVEADRRILERK